MITIDNYSQHSYNNRKVLDREGTFTCYYCLREGYTVNIREWVDFGGTAICHYCSIDSCLPGKIDKDLLEQIHEKSFKR